MYYAASDPGVELAMQTFDEAEPGQTSGPRRRGPRPRTPAPPQEEIRLRPAACRRLALGLSTYELAQRARLDEQTVVRFEAGLSRPRQVTVVALHNALRRMEATQDSPARRPSAEGT